MGLFMWSRRKFDFELFVKVFLTVVIILILSSINSLPQNFFSFSTSEPLGNQWFSVSSVILLKSLFLGFFIAVVAGFIRKWSVDCADDSHGDNFTMTGWGFIILAFLAITKSLVPAVEPPSISYEHAGTYFPVLGYITSTLMKYLFFTVSFMYYFGLIGNLSNRWRRKKAIIWIITTLSVLALTGNYLIPELTVYNILIWLISGFIGGWILILIYKKTVIYSFSSIPYITASFILGELIIDVVQRVTPDVLPGAILSILIIVFISGYISRKFEKKA